jgi:hypothetical protein
MASFIPNHRKKKESLARKKMQLRRLIVAGADREKLLQAALKVRDGRISVLRAKQNQNPERNANERAVFLNDEEKIRALRALSAEAILAEFLPD